MNISSVGMANLGYWGVLPMGISNYGGDVQVYNIPDYTNTNLYLGFNDMALNSLNSPFLGMPCQIPSAPIPANLAENLADALWQPVAQNLAESNLGSVGSTIQATKAKLNSKLQTEGISDEDKEKIKALLERLDEQEKKLKDIKENENLTNEEKYQKSKEIEKAMRDIAAETAQLQITPQKAKEPQGANDNNNTNTNTNTTSSQEAELAQLLARVEELLAGKETNQAGEANEGFFVDPKYAQQRAELEAQVQDAIDAQTGGVRSAAEIAQRFRDAIEGWGTDDKEFENICSQINKDNVMELMLAYNQLQSREHGESFMEAFMWDADHGQKAKFGKQIANALKEKALELGVYDECKDDFAEIYDELGDWFISNDISKNFDNIVEILANAMGKPEYARPYEAK